MSCFALRMHGCQHATDLGKALRLQRAGDLGQAAAIYQAILAGDPQHADALHYLGVILQSAGQLEEAVQLIVQSLQINPQNPAALNNLAGVLTNQRRFEDAIEFFHASLAQDPRQSMAHNNLGNVYRELGRTDEAIASFQSALAAEPNSVAAQNNLGTVFKDLGQNEQAAKCYRAALSIDPQSHEALVNLGVVLKEQARFAEADQCFEAALKIRPNSDAACANFAASLKEQGRLAEAVEWNWRALSINPRSSFALNNLGNALQQMGNFTEAVHCFGKAIEHQPSFHLAHNNLGSALVQLGRCDEALACFRRALELKPDYRAAFSNLLFTRNYLPGQDRAELFAEHRRFDEKFAAPLQVGAAPHPNERNPDKRLRVGFVSGDLRDHPVASFIEPVFAHHNTEYFELFCYANLTPRDAVSERLRSQVEHWRDVIGWSDDELAEAIRRDEIDILVDLSGHTAGNRLLVFARKPAPIQVGMIGYMQTTGLSTMDYRITDAQLDPIGETERYNVEELVRIPAGAATFRPPSDAPEVNDLPALKNGHITFASFNNLAKVTPEALAAWAQILQSVENSRLLIVGREGNSVHTSLLEHGIAEDRIEMIPRLPLADFLALHHRVDILLDTFPYNGGTTNLLALWMGVPFVSLAGAATASRTGAGMLRGVGQPQLIASSTSDYISKAIDLAGDLPALAELRQSLRPALRPSFQDPSIFTRQLQRAFRTMWRKWCAA